MHPGATVRRLSAVLGLAAMLAGCSGAAATPASTATATPSPTPPPVTVTHPGAMPVAGTPPTDDQPWFLTVGDSVTSGYTVDPARAAVNSSWALQLEPLLAVTGRHWSLYDTACPGERTTTYFTLCPGRAAVPFLASTSQHDAALAAVTAHHASLKAIFVELGSNDVLDARGAAATITAVESTLRTNLTRIVTELQAAAPGVPVILCNFFNPFANTDPSTRGAATTLNAFLADLARSLKTKLADFAAAIDTSTAVPDPTLCTYVDCAHGDIHPTVAGHAALARAALAALGPA